MLSLLTVREGALLSHMLVLGHRDGEISLYKVTQPATDTRCNAHQEEDDLRETDGLHSEDDQYPQVGSQGRA